MSSRPWVEKYRPRQLENVVHQAELVAALKKSLESSDFPNLLFYGPPGTGKTSSIIAFARSMFKSQYESRVLQLNASDDRGIVVIRERLRRFAQINPVKAEGIANLKLVILDEADSMTHAAQACLRRTMETYSRTTRFCLICNYVSRIIQPIASRCSKYRFKPISKELMAERLQYICQVEGVQCHPETLDQLVDVSDGDLRQAITFLQSSHRLLGKAPITKDIISEISGYIPQRFINKFIADCKSKSLERVAKYTNELACEGYATAQFLSQIHDWLLTYSNFSDETLAKVLKLIAVAEYRLNNGSDEWIQLLYLGAGIFKAYQEKL